MTSPVILSKAAHTALEGLSEIRQHPRQKLTGRWKFGLALALVTLLLWSTLSIALRLVLEKMDAITLTSYRFLVAAVFLALFLHRRHGLSAVRKFRAANDRILILVVAGAFAVGIPLYAYALKFIPAGAAPILYQVGSLVLLIGGVTLFRERFSRMQAAGGGLLVVV